MARREAPQPAKPVEPSPAPQSPPAIGIDPAVEATVRSAGDLGTAAVLLREHHPELSQAERIDAIRSVCRKIAENYCTSPQRREIARLALQHRGERFEGEP